MKREKEIESMLRAAGVIQVPFSLQAPLSGALAQLSPERLEKLRLAMPPAAPGLNQHLALWYGREVLLPKHCKHWESSQSKVLLHLGACDATAQVWVNGKSFKEHQGGNTMITLDITEALRIGTEVVQIVVKCTELPQRPVGKQIYRKGIYKKKKQVPTLYSNITGIWQTVWLESVPHSYLRDVEITPKQLEKGAWAVELRGFGVGQAPFSAALYRGKAVVATASGDATLRLVVPKSDVELWSGPKSRR